MGQLHRMSKLLQLGLCEKCFCFRGVKSCPDPLIKNSNIPIQFPVCASTCRPAAGYCNRKITKQSKASQGIKPTKTTRKKQISNPGKIMVWVDGKQFEQAHFKDYLKQLRLERKAKNG